MIKMPPIELLQLFQGAESFLSALYFLHFFRRTKVKNSQVYYTIRGMRNDDKYVRGHHETN